MAEVTVKVAKRGPHSGRELLASDIVAARFWAKVRRVNGDGCWLWIPTYRNGGGYPMFGICGWGGKPTNAARVAYALEHGRTPTGLLIRHLCNTKSCVRPSHLATGSQRDNARDRRHEGGDLVEHWAVVCAIREAYAQGVPAARLAAFFGLTREVAGDIVCNSAYVNDDYTPVKRTGPGTNRLSLVELEDAFRRWTADGGHTRTRGQRGTVTVKGLAAEFGVGLATMYDALHVRLQQAA